MRVASSGFRSELFVSACYKQSGSAEERYTQNHETNYRAHAYSFPLSPSPVRIISLPSFLLHHSMEQGTRICAHFSRKVRIPSPIVQSDEGWLYLVARCFGRRSSLPDSITQDFASRRAIHSPLSFHLNAGGPQNR